MERKDARVVAETDEELMMKFLEGEELEVDEIKKTVRKMTIENQMVPMMCGSAYKNKGVQMLAVSHEYNSFAFLYRLLKTLVQDLCRLN